MTGIHPSISEDTRGQLILIGGIILAFLLIVLVLILNGVLYTENIATREQPQAIDRTVDAGAVVEGTTGDLIQMELDEKYEDEGVAAENVERDVTSMGELLDERSFEAHGEVIDISAENMQNAWVISQPEDSDFRAAENTFGFEDVFGWDLVTADGIRDANMTVTSARTIDTEEENQASDVFRMDITGDGGDGDTWSVWIYDDPSQSGIALATETDSDGNPIAECTSSGTPAEIDWVEMTVDGNACDIEFAEGVGDGPYEIRYQNGDEIEGTYQFVVGKGPGTEIGTEAVSGDRHVADTMEGDDPDEEDPRAYDGVYSATVTFEVEGETVTAETLSYVAPREPEATTSSEKP